jgi:hypothetical protein
MVIMVMQLGAEQPRGSPRQRARGRTETAPPKGKIAATE